MGFVLFLKPDSNALAVDLTLEDVELLFQETHNVDQLWCLKLILFYKLGIVNCGKENKANFVLKVHRERDQDERGGVLVADDVDKVHLVVEMLEGENLVENIFQGYLALNLQDQA